MSAKSVFQYRDYKSYLTETLSTSGERRGARARLAQALGCQNTFVSQVLNGATHFSLEHAAVIADFLGLSAEESHFFILLVHHGRAGTIKLRHYYEAQMQEILERRKVIQDRVRVRDSLSMEDQLRYYSGWQYAAIHVLVSIPAFQTKDALAVALGIPPARMAEYLDFLTAAGIVKRAKERYIHGPSRIHIGRDSPMLSKHHANWRLRAIESADLCRADDLHYTSVYSLSKSDVERIRTILLDTIETTEPLLRASREETAYCMNLDFFPIHDQ